jgi:hypothetical protein
VLAGVNREDIDALAKQYEEAGTEAGYWSAARLHSAIALNMKGLGSHDTCEYYLKALAAVKHLRTKSQPGALALEILCRTRIMWISRTEAEAMQMANAMLAIAKLDTDDIAKLDPADAKALCGNKMYVSLVMIGTSPTSFSFSLNLAQAKKGVLMLMDAFAQRYSRAVVDSFPLGSFERYYHLDLSTFPIAGTDSICLLELSARQKYITSVGDIGALTREVFEMYDSERFHARSVSRYARFVSYSNTRHVKPPFSFVMYLGRALIHS